MLPCGHGALPWFSSDGARCVLGDERTGTFQWVNQCLPAAAVFDYRCISRDKLFTHAQSRAEWSLCNHHMPVLALNIDVADIAKKVEQLAQDGGFGGMIRARVELGVLIIDGGKNQEKMEGVSQPVMPDYIVRAPDTPWL